MPRKHCSLLDQPAELVAGMDFHIPTVAAVGEPVEEVIEAEAPWRHVEELDDEEEVR